MTAIRTGSRRGVGASVGRGDGHGRQRGLFSLLAACLVLAPFALTVPASARELTPIPVKPAGASSPAADGAWFGWARFDSSSESPNYFVQKGTKPRVRVNPRGTVADGGGISGQMLVYAQGPQAYPSPKNLFRLNVRTGRRAAFPDPVNTRRAEESSPTLSGRYLLFDRSRTKQEEQIYVSKVMLYDRRTGVVRTLAKISSGFYDQCAGFVGPGQVNGAFAVWVIGLSCDGYTGAEVVRYNIRRDVKTELGPPRLRDISQFSPAISSEGTVYYVRRNTENHRQWIVKKPVGAPPEIVYTVPSKENAYARDLYVDERAKARHLYFALDGSNAGIYKLIDPLASTRLSSQADRSPPGRSRLRR